MIKWKIVNKPELRQLSSGTYLQQGMGFPHNHQRALYSCKTHRSQSDSIDSIHSPVIITKSMCLIMFHRAIMRSRLDHKPENIHVIFHFISMY